jgi:hypothetical protein
MNKDVLFADIKEAFPQLDNKEINRFCVKHWSNISAWHRKDKKEGMDAVKAEAEKVSSGAEYPDDFVLFTPEQRAEEVAKLLDYKLKTKELTASELRELKDIFNLKAKDQDIKIEQVDFRAVEPELADIVAAVEWQIIEYNKEG